MRVISLFVLLVVHGAACTATEPATQPTVPTDVDEVSPTWTDEAQLAFVAVDDSALVLTWTAATDDVGISAYHVYKDEVKIAVLDGGLTSLQVHQLDPNSEYTFRVEAADPAGNMSSDGPTGTIKTGDETAPTWPQESALNAANLTASGVSLTWTHADDNVAVTGYRVFQDNHQIAAIGAGTTELVAESLDAWRSYSFRVEAEDAMGNLSTSGPTTTIETADSNGPTWPESAQIIASNIEPTRVDLGWLAAVDDVAITHYQVLQDKVGIELLNGATTWLTVYGLDPWTQYEFTVVALDAAGNASDSSLVINLQTTDDTTPTWPDDSVVLASNPTDTGVTLGWTAAQDNVAVASYRVYQDNVAVGTYDGNITSAVVDGLTSDVGYLLRIEAEDAAGNLSFGGPSLWVDLSDTSPPVWPLDADCLATGLTPTSVELGWSTAADNTAVAGYQVWSAGGLVKSLPGDQTSVTIDSLEPLTDYTFTLVAVDWGANMTTDGPSVSISTPDYPQPTWPLDATLTAGSLTSSSVAVAWSAPVDDQPIAFFEVYHDDSKVLTVDGSNSSGLVTGLSPLSDYDLRVEAVGPTGNVSDDGPSVSVSTPHYPAPMWPEDASLELSDVTETGLSLSWSAMDATQATASYQVIQNGMALTTADAATTSVAVDGLSPGTTYTFGVEALGPTGLQSTNGPTVTATTSDSTAPTWPAGATLTALKAGASTVELAWTAAVDNVGVAAYKVLQDGQEAATVDSETTTTSISGLSASTTYDFEVLAADGAYQWTDGGPTTTVTTGPEALTNQEVFEGLQSSCDLCHADQTPPLFMASLDNFNTLLVQDDKLVVPGDPDASLVIQLMEGDGGLPFAQMPLWGDDFKTASNKGNTDITLEEVRYWIQLLPSDLGAQ